MEIYRPFGPFIGKFRLPENLINDFNKAADRIGNDKNLSQEMDFSEQLAGKVRQELEIPVNLVQHYDPFWRDILQKYVRSTGDNVLVREDMGLHIKSAWFVRSFAGDFNPVHCHPNASLSITGYLKIPDWNDELQKDAEDHSPAIGKIAFQYGNMYEWSNNSIMMTPEVGDCYIFPAMLMHMVYPFKSDGERRSFAINIAKASL